MPPSRDETTLLVTAATAGDAGAVERLMPVVYAELHDLAGQWFRRERMGHTLQPTALVNEAFVKLVSHGHVDAAGTTCFKGIAARVMGQVLVEHARRRDAAKRGGGWERVTLADVGAQLRISDVDFSHVTDAVVRLAELNKRQARIVELRFFGGLTNPEIASALNVSLSTVESDWRIARAWLRRELSAGDGTV